MLLLLGALAAGLACLGPVSAVASAAQGDLDPSFDGDGKVITDVDPSAPGDLVQGVAVQDDGKIVAVGQDPVSFERNVSQLVRYNRDGSLDAGFGGDGTVLTPESLYVDAAEVALQPDGKMVVAGQGYDEAENLYGLAVVRYHADGTLDTSFGEGDGIVVADIPFPPGAEFLDARAWDVAIEGDGKIVAAGTASTTIFGTYSHAAAIARFTSDGRRDPTFGSGGQQTIPIGNSSNFGDFERDLGLAVQPDGKSVIATTVFPREGSQEFLLARFTALGALDPTFGGDGIVTTNFRTFSEGGVSFGSVDAARDVALQPDGKIIAVGYSARQGAGIDDPTREFALARYSPAGSLDQSFDGDGKVLSDAGGMDSAEAVALQGDGKIVAAGSNPSEFLPSEGRFTRGDFVLFRYTASGSLDPGFGAGGRVITPFGPGLDGAEDLAIQPADGKIVAAGFTTLDGSDGDLADFALARYQGQPPAGPTPPAGGESPPAGRGSSEPAPAFADCPTSTANLIRGSAASERITGTRFADRIFAGTGNDIVDGLAASDCIDLGPGTDRGQGGDGDDLVVGGLGRDRIVGNSGNDRLRGGSSGDRLIGGFGNDRLHGQSGSDRINGERGRDRINGGSSNDVISAGSSNDRVAGDQGGDRINGNSGNDVLKGNSGNDRITGSTGSDRLSGNGGNDRINARDGRRDRVNCGRGRDRVAADRFDRVSRNCERVRRR